MTIYQKQKNILFVAIMCLLLSVIGFISFLIYQNQAKKLIKSEGLHLQHEIQMLGGFLKESLLRLDYAEAINFLGEWKENKPIITELIVRLEDNNEIFNHQSDSPFSLTQSGNFTIGDNKFSITIGHDIKETYDHIDDLKITLLANTLIITGFIGFILWFLLSNWILRPLNREIKRQTKQLTTYSDFIDNIIDSMSSHIAIINQQGIIIRTNKAWMDYAKQNGYKGEPSMHGESYFQCCGVGERPAICKEKCNNPFELGVLQVLKGELSEFVGDYDCFNSITKEWYNIHANPFYWNNEKLVLISHENISNIKGVQVELEQKSTQLEKINHAFKALSKSNISLVKANTQQDLFDQVCEIIYRDCSYELVWIGQPEQDSDKSVSILSSAGSSLDYLDNITLSWKNNEAGNGPVGRSIREKQIIIIKDTQTDQSFKPWKEKAKSFGFAACASFPIIWKKQVLAVLTVYSQHADSFTFQEIKLLQELSNNLAFGIQSIEDRQQIKKLSITDHLTKLYNRRHIISSLEAEITRFRRYGNPVSIIILDIDYFKTVNDQFGHHVGDRVLIEFSGLLEKYSRQLDIIGRWGGEEFIIILPNTDNEEAYRLAERIRYEVSHYSFFEVNHKTTSLGVSTINKFDTTDSLIERADQALYQAKNQGRDQVIVSD